MILLDGILNESAARTFIYAFCFMGIFLFLFSISINIPFWISEFKFSRKLNKSREKTIRIRYEIYVVGFPSGEIFYVNKKKLNKLKRKNLICWNNSIGCYVFSDNQVEDVKKQIEPIIIYESTRKSSYYNEF